LPKLEILKTKMRSFHLSFLSFNLLPLAPYRLPLGQEFRQTFDG
jgi:hypothetical protein